MSESREILSNMEQRLIFATGPPASFLHRRLVGGENVLTETGEDDLLGDRVSVEERHGLAYGDPGRLSDGIAVDAAADGGKGDPPDVMFRRQQQAVDVASGQER